MSTTTSPTFTPPAPAGPARKGRPVTRTAPARTTSAGSGPAATTAVTPPTAAAGLDPFDGALPYTRGSAARMLLLHRRRDWQPLLDRQAQLPQATTVLRDLVRGGDTPDRDLTRSLRSHIAAVGPIKTREIDRLDKVVSRVCDDNLWGSMGRKEFVAADGDGPGAGKSQCIGTVALRIARDAWAQTGKTVGADENEHWPVGYVEVNSSTRQLGLMESIYRFFGFPKTPRETATSLLGRLGDQLDAVGCQLLILDDAHQLRQVGKETRQLTDFLKALVTSLPVTVVFVGNQLRNSAILKPSDDDSYIAADQLRVRHQLMTFPIYKPDVPQHRDWLRRILRELEQQIVVPDPAVMSKLLDDDVLELLLQGSGGRVGRSIDWAKRAISATVAKPQLIDVEFLQKHART